MKKRKLFCEYGPIAYKISLKKEAIKLQINMLINQISKVTKLSVEEIKKLQ